MTTKQLFVGTAVVSVVLISGVLWLTMPTKATELPDKPPEAVVENPEPAPLGAVPAVPSEDGYSEVTAWLAKNLDSGEFSNVRFWPALSIEVRIALLQEEADGLIQMEVEREIELLEQMESLEKKRQVALELLPAHRQRVLDQVRELTEKVVDLNKKSIAFKLKLRAEQKGSMRFQSGPVG